MIIDATYFKGPLTIEGLNTYTGEVPSVTNDAVTDMAEAYISVYGREYLLRMLGPGLSPQVSDTEEQPMKGLVDMLRDCGGISPVACYVFFKLVGRNGTAASAVGATKAASDLSVSPNPLLVTAWNLMAERNLEIDAYVRKNGMDGYSPDHTMFERISVLGL